MGYCKRDHGTFPIFHYLRVPNKVSVSKTLDSSHLQVMSPFFVIPCVFCLGKNIGCLPLTQRPNRMRTWCNTWGFCTFPLLGFPNKDYSLLGLYWGPPTWGNYHVDAVCMCRPARLVLISCADSFSLFGLYSRQDVQPSLQGVSVLSSNDVFCRVFFQQTRPDQANPDL